MDPSGGQTDDGKEEPAIDGTIPDNTSQDPDTGPAPTIPSDPDDEDGEEPTGAGEATPTITEPEGPTPTGADEETPTPGSTRYEDGTHKMIVECTEGARVYIDGDYSGTITGGRLEIPKQVGEMTVRLELDGYVPKSYMIEVEDEDEDVRFSFPDMVRSN